MEILRQLIALRSQSTNKFKSNNPSGVFAPRPASAEIENPESSDQPAAVAKKSAPNEGPAIDEPGEEPATETENPPEKKAITKVKIYHGSFQLIRPSYCDPDIWAKLRKDIINEMATTPGVTDLE